MNDKTLDKLEFHKVKDILKSYAITEGGKNNIDELVPSKVLSEASRLQKETSEAIHISIKQGKITLGPLKSVTPILKRIEVGAVLGGGDLLSIRDVLRYTRQAKNYYQDALAAHESYPILKGRFQSLMPFTEIEREINRCILAPDRFADDATPELANIRRQIKSLGVKIKEAIQQMLHSSRYSDMIQEPVVTLRQDRYCIPIKVECKSQFKGIVHDQSATGATVFIEPMTVVEMGNNLRGYEAREQEEIEKLLASLTEQIAPITKEVDTDYLLLTELDSIFARSEFSLKYDCREPKLNDKGYINLKKARHPLLPKENVVPIDVYVGGDFTTLLITGPNTGGKTVTLKTMGLFSLMAAIGLQVPAAEGSEVAIFEGIYADLGDEQSIEQSLSTFSAHMTNIVRILKDMSLNSLVLLDEVGSGTDPIEGAALAMAILEHLRKQQIRTVATTHYSELKLYAISTEGTENASCEFDVEKLKPTYKLLIGIPGKSNAFAISMKLGLPEYLIDDAKEYLKKENVKMEDILVDLEQNRKMAEIESEKAKHFRDEAERLKEEIDKERKKLEKVKKKVLERAEIKAKEMLKEAERTTDQILKDVRSAARKAQAAIDEKSLYEAKQNATQSLAHQDKKVNKIVGRKEEKKLTEVSIGEEVMVLSLMQQGTVSSLPDKAGNVEVRVGIMPMKVPLTGLGKVKEEAKPANKTNNKKVKQRGGTTSSYNISKASTISTEVDVRGMMVEEAWQVIDKYLDDAYITKLSQITIIHGKGTGALRAGIVPRLKRHPHVLEQRPGLYGEGEMGVTIVTIR